MGGCSTECAGEGAECSITSCAGGCDLYCTEGASCHLAECGGGCMMDCGGPLCALDHCGGGCFLQCDRGRTCSIGECTNGGCTMQPIGTRREDSTLGIEVCAGGSCTINCAPLRLTCWIGSCAGQDCVINCSPGAACTCPETGCTVVDM